MENFKSTTLKAPDIYLTEIGGDNESLHFQYLPEFMQWDRVPNWVNVPIVGRNNSKKHLTGGEDRLSFSLDFNSLYEDDKQMAMRKLAWIQSLTFTDGELSPTRKVKLTWGDVDMFRHKVWIIKLVKGRISHFLDYKQGYMPVQLLIDVILELDPDTNLRLNEIRDFSPAAIRTQSNHLTRT